MTTHGGVPQETDTRRSQRRITQVLVTLAASLALAAAGVLFPVTDAYAVGTFSCNSQWHFIKASQVGRNVKPDPNAGPRYGKLVATGGPDYWNQEFLFCRWSWWNIDTFAIRSNFIGGYWCNINPGAHQSDFSTNCGVSRDEDLTNNYYRFEVKKYDARFWTIRYLWNPYPCCFDPGYVYADAADGNYLHADRGAFLGGDNLFEITPTNLIG